MSQPQAQPVAVDVEGAEPVAGVVTAVEGRPKPRGPLALGPARAVAGDAARAGPSGRSRSPHPPWAPAHRAKARARLWSRSRGPGRPSTSACAETRGQASASRRPRCAGETSIPCPQEGRQPWQRPARQRHPLGVGTDTGHRHDPRPLRGGDPAGSPARRPLARREMLGALEPPFQRNRLAVRQRPEEHLRGRHHHFQHRDASPVATHQRFRSNLWKRPTRFAGP